MINKLTLKNPSAADVYNVLVVCGIRGNISDVIVDTIMRVYDDDTLSNPPGSNGWNTTDTIVYHDGAAERTVTIGRDDETKVIVSNQYWTGDVYIDFPVDWPLSGIHNIVGGVSKDAPLAITLHHNNINLSMPLQLEPGVVVAETHSIVTMRRFKNVVTLCDALEEIRPIRVAIVSTDTEAVDLIIGWTEMFADNFIADDDYPSLADLEE